MWVHQLMLALVSESPPWIDQSLVFWSDNLKKKNEDFVPLQILGQSWTCSFSCWFSPNFGHVSSLNGHLNGLFRNWGQTWQTLCA